MLERIISELALEILTLTWVEFHSIQIPQFLPIGSTCADAVNPRLLKNMPIEFNSTFVSIRSKISVPKPLVSFEAQLVVGKAHDLEPINCHEQPNLLAVLSTITCGKQKHEAELKYPQRIRKLNLFLQIKLR
ncbi:Nuclear cap-binding protein subunit 1 [Camellia lanceoleosa]|uniref:Nuclear cap-binding protein subunit 1 n=1 Tax=Camellia lanceoleosa TaxID=1840588 RepID=A0ACC0H1E2_9ERIC|nr:Nuclear cap-binding protein subunit 1 [Camellia lanceoleosa]